MAVIDFTAGWCGPCQMFAPIFESVSEKIGSVKFGKVDVDSQSDVAQENSVMSVPTIIIFKKGEEVDRKNGYMNETEFTKWVESNK
jgi:thioredoxin